MLFKGPTPLSRLPPMKQRLHELHIKRAACDGGEVYHQHHVSQIKGRSLVRMVAGSPAATGAPRAADAPEAWYAAEADAVDRAAVMDASGPLRTRPVRRRSGSAGRPPRRA